MRLKRLILTGLCLIGVCEITSATASAGAPRWYGKETGALVPFSGRSGLVEITSPETLQGVGQVRVATANLTVCLIKSRESVENPSDALAAGTGNMAEFELICEEGTGVINDAQPFPCTNGEAFELKGLGLDWPSILEVGPLKKEASKGNAVRDLPRYYDKLAGVSLELYCLKSKAHNEYKGSLRAEVEVGRLKFGGPEFGVLEDSSGHRFSLIGIDVFTQTKYKDVRVNSVYHELTTMSSLIDELSS